MSSVVAQLTAQQFANQPTELVDIDALRPADSPRLLGENDEVIQTLTGTDAQLPPILVHRATMRIIDGMHRYRAALRQGAATMRVHFFDGDEESAFALAVQANIAHGLPLTLADRRAAAIRIMGAHPEWSNRAIADLTGLASKTVDGIRQATGDDTQLNVKRLGRDGRLRPVNTSDGRRRASEALSRRPNAPLRQIADEAGVSLGTVRDVRNRIRNGEDPVLPRQRGRAEENSVTPSALDRLADSAERVAECEAIRQQLLRDPAVRMSSRGRSLMRWLDARAVSARELMTFVDGSPAHCRTVLARLALHYSEMWSEYADALKHTVTQKSMDDDTA